MWDEELQEWFFSVVDIVQVLTDSVDVKQYIKKMRKRDPELEARWGTICTPVRMQATDGKYYNTQAYWRKLKQRLKDEGNETVTNCHALKMRAADGKMLPNGIAPNSRKGRGKC